MLTATMIITIIIIVRHQTISIVADPLVIEPNLSIIDGLAAAGISSIAFREPLFCHSSLRKEPTDFKTAYDWEAYCAGMLISSWRVSDFKAMMERNLSTMSFTCSSACFADQLRPWHPSSPVLCVWEDEEGVFGINVGLCNRGDYLSSLLLDHLSSLVGGEIQIPLLKDYFGNLDLIVCLERL